MTQTQSDLEIQGKSAFPASKKIYVPGTREDVKVPFREVTLTPRRDASATNKSTLEHLRHQRPLHRRRCSTSPGPGFACPAPPLDYGTWRCGRV